MPAIVSVRSMVCRRCVMSVEQILAQLGLGPAQVELGRIALEQEPTTSELTALDQALRNVGFELISSRNQQLIESIKLRILHYVAHFQEIPRTNLSRYITETIPYDYSYLSDLFSGAAGQSIEQFFIAARIDKVKELIAYEQASLTEIADTVGFSSVHHLSTQFRKVTGMTPTQFKKLRAVR